MQTFQILGTLISCKVTPIIGFTHIYKKKLDSFGLKCLRLFKFPEINVGPYLNFKIFTSDGFKFLFSIISLFRITV